MFRHGLINRSMNRACEGKAAELGVYLGQVQQLCSARRGSERLIVVGLLLWPSSAAGCCGPVGCLGLPVGCLRVCVCGLGFCCVC